jgi:hypothetical protein
MNKYEKLIEYIINENEQKARELFHEIVVEKSRDIYESLMDEDEMNEMGGMPVEELGAQVTGDENGGIAEEEGEEEFSLDGEDSEDEDELGGDLPPTDMGGDDMGSDEPATKADIDELKDMFAEIQAQLDGGHSEPDADNMDGMDSMDGPAEVGAEEPKFGEGMMEAEESDEDTEDDKDEDKEDKAEVKETKSNGPKSVAQLMREYVDQIGQVYGGEGDNAEGTESGNGKKVPVNTKSITRTNGPDFGGTSKNLNRGGSEQSPDGKQTPKPNNEYSKGEGKFSNEKFQNAPGGSKKTSPVGKNWESANSPEGQTTGGKVPVSDKSVLKQNTGK